MDETGKIRVEFKYSKEAVALIKSFKGAKWHPEEKYWSIEYCEDYKEKISLLFQENNRLTVEFEDGSIKINFIKKIPESIINRIDILSRVSLTNFAKNNQYETNIKEDYKLSSSINQDLHDLTDYKRIVKDATEIQKNRFRTFINSSISLAS